MGKATALTFRYLLAKIILNYNLEKILGNKKGASLVLGDKI